ncbi:MAG: acyl-CoA desaturase [Thermoleophilaceae bacterium]
MSSHGTPIALAFCAMTRLERTTNIVAVVLPFLAFLTAVSLLWNQVIASTDLVVLVVLYLLSAFGVTLGYHRLLTHRAFKTRPWFAYLLAVLGSTSVQGPVIDWVADHRKHHAFTDEEGDPHSPHTGHGSGMRGLWHAHVGWLFETQGQAAKRQYARDLLEDPGMRRINRAFPLLALASLLVPFLLGWVLSSTLDGALGGLLWGGLVRIFFLHHVTWSINSICHFYGRRRFDTDDHSTNVFWLAPISLGEAWHHNHHAFPRSATHGLRWWEIDPTGLLVNALERVGLIWDVTRIAPERQRAKRVVA